MIANRQWMLKEGPAILDHALHGMHLHPERCAWLSDNTLALSSAVGYGVFRWLGLPPRTTRCPPRLLSKARTMGTELNRYYTELFGTDLGTDAGQLTAKQIVEKLIAFKTVGFK